MANAKGYTTYNPHGKWQHWLECVDQIFEDYADYRPLTLRQVFYLLVANYGYDKTENAYQNLSAAMGRARRSGRIPFEYLRDDSLVHLMSGDYEDPDDFYAHTRRAANGYRRDKLARQPNAIRVHCEAAGMMQQLSRTCRQFSVPVYSCSGFDSLTAKHDLKEQVLKDNSWTGRGTVVLHLGDCDPSGESIYESMVEDITAFLEEDLRDLPYTDVEDVVTFRRVLLGQDFAERLNLESAPAKKTDTRAKSWGNKPTYQLEAVPPDTMSRVLTGTILEYLDEDQLEFDKEQEGEDRHQILRELPSGD